MTLDLAKSGPLHGPGARKAFVEAIRDAGPDLHETDWLEWKSRVDIREKSWQGEIATHIIGFANREPGHAKRTAGGHAYLVLGAEPGAVHGVDACDPADLESRIARYSGRAEGPRWEPHLAAIDGRKVLVIDVGPPQQGDPIFSLRKQFTDPSGLTVPDGAVFIRRQGKTDRARSGDYDMLNRRAAQKAIAFAVELVWWEQPSTVHAIDPGETERSAWLDAQRKELMQPLEGDSDATLMPALARAFMGENRSPAQYRQQVEQYLGRAAEALPPLAKARAVEAGIGRVHLAVANQTEHNFSEVAVELYLQGTVVAFFDADEAFEAANFPARPILFGTQRPIMPFPNVDLPRPTVVGPSRGYIDNAASARIRFAPVDVRPDHRHALSSLNLIVDGQHAGQTLTAAWCATATNVSGVASGEFEVEVARDPIPFRQVMAAKAS
jgi:hypothetical protein